MYLVQKLAYSGKCDKQEFIICLKSIVAIYPTSLIKIYGNHEKNLNVGLKILISILTFSKFSYSYIEFIRYVFNMIVIENKLQKNCTNLYILKKYLLDVSSKYSIHQDIDILTSELAKIYIKKISCLGSRILVQGTKNFLENIKIQEKIRCLLFAGIRSVCLWKQFGGNQYKIILHRNHIVKKAKKILYHLKETI